MSLSASRPAHVGLQQSIAELKHCHFFSTALRPTCASEEPAERSGHGRSRTPDLASSGAGDAPRPPQVALLARTTLFLTPLRHSAMIASPAMAAAQAKPVVTERFSAGDGPMCSCPQERHL